MGSFKNHVCGSAEELTRGVLEVRCLLDESSQTERISCETRPEGGFAMGLPAPRLPSPGLCHGKAEPGDHRLVWAGRVL